MVSRRQLLLGALASSGVLTGCASAPEPRPADGRTYCMSTLRTKRTVCTPEPVPLAAAEADAKRFEATPGVLTVYVVRSAWVDAVRPLTVSVDGNSQFGTLPRSLIRLRLAPGTHQLAFEWNERVHGFAVTGEAGELRIVELAGSSVARGDIVLGSVASANRDDRQFEAPDVLEFDRKSNRHLTFGEGGHYCVGAALGRMEGRVAFNALLRSFPGMKIAMPEAHLKWRPNPVLRGLKKLVIAA